MDREAALIMGINTERINSPFFWHRFCPGRSGRSTARDPLLHLSLRGWNLRLICFCIVALGGFGSIEGAFIAGILVGVVQTLGGYIFDPAYKLAIVFVMYLITVLDQAARAQGVIG